MANLNLAQGVARPPEAVLVVEGDVLLRMTLSAYLKDCGFRVIQAANADEAIMILEELEPPVDIVLSEVVISGELDGFGLAQWIRKNRPGLPVMLVGTPGRAASAAAQLCHSGPNPSNVEHPEIILQRIRRLLAERSRQESRRYQDARA
jgi:DNA-binding NtrC family response regulator